MTEEGVPIDILVSNHSIEFICAYEEYKPGGRGFKSKILSKEVAYSLNSLGKLVEEGIIEAKEVITIAQKNYCPNLKLISCDYLPTDAKKEI